MRLASISLRNLRIRALSTVLTTISIAIGTMLLASLWMMIAQTEEQYRNSAIGYGTIVGAKAGSSLDLVLNTVYNVGQPENRVPFSVYRELHDSRGRIDGANRQIALRYTIPQARGDTFRSYPIVGTTDEMFTKFHFEVDSEKQPVLLGLSEGEAWSYSHEQFVEFTELIATKMANGEPVSFHEGGGHGSLNEMDGDEIRFGPENKAVLGYEVARKLGMGIGSQVTPLHGKEGDPNAHVHLEAVCEVVGVLERTGTPIDRVIYVPISTFLSMAGHDAIRETDDAEADNVTLTAIICRGRRSNDDMNIRWAFEGRRDAQAVFAWQEVGEFLDKVGTATDVLRIISLLVLVVAAVSVLVALYNTMNERRREIAIMRSLGARASQIVAIVIGEAAAVSVAGGLLGVVASHAVAALAVDVIADQSGVVLDWAAFSIDELWLILGVAVLGCFAGLLPAIKGSRTEVAENLGPIS